MDYTCEELYQLADKAGKQAAQATVPIPMVVCTHENMADDSSPVVHRGVVNDGVCGFAWVNIKPAYSRFAKYLVANGLASKDSYEGGVSLWVHDYNQSMTLKAAYARGFAGVLRAAGINAVAHLRID